MKSVTFIKLTDKERLAMIRTEEALEELAEHVNVNSSMLEEVERAHRHLINIMCYLEDMGNEFVLPIKEEDEKGLDYSWKGTVPESY